MSRAPSQAHDSKHMRIDDKYDTIILNPAIYLKDVAI